MNKKGQALTEFILVLPVLLLILTSLIDIGSIFINKYELNKDLDTVTMLYESKKQKELLAYTAKEEINFEETKENDLVTLTLKKELRISTPILSNIIGKYYTIESQRTIVGDNDE